MAVELIPSRHGCQRALAVRKLSLVNPTGFRLSYSLSLMIIHRYLFAYYRQVAVYFWPILFLNLWRVDLWCAETGRQAFVQVDRYGRAWVPYFEGMSVNYMTHDYYERFYAPSDVEDLCPQIFERAITALTVDASASWGLRTTLTNRLGGMLVPWTPATQSSWVQRCAGVDGPKVQLDPG